jgi:membrane protease YdiL (CAAX protease family)
MKSSDENKTFPNLTEAAFVVVALFAVEYLLGAAATDLARAFHVERRDVMALVVLLSNGLVFSGLMHFKKLTYRTLFHASPNSVWAVLGLLTIPILLLVPGLVLAMGTLTMLLQRLAPMSPWEVAMFERMMSGGLPTAVTVCLIAPIVEEMLFRGIVLRSFLHQYSTRNAVVFSALLFGAAHLNIYQFLAGSLLGLLLGWLYERTRTLWPCILLHGAYNSGIAWLSFDAGVASQDAFEGLAGVIWMFAFAGAGIGATLLQRCLQVRRPIVVDPNDPR